MAKTKESTSSKKTVTKTTEEKEVKNTNVSTENAAPSMNAPETQSGPSYDELLSLVRDLNAQIQELKSNSNSAITTPSTTSIDKTNELLGALANRKADKEIVIVHNCELNGGLTTHIDLSTLSIDLRTMGEERTLSWTQFEELVSKYRSFFERGIIKVGSAYADIAKRYNVPCVEENNSYTLSHDDFDKMGDLDVRQLEELYNKLDDHDKTTLISYFMGKCYEKVPGYYDRYKMETLGRLSGRDSFSLLINILNNEERG